MPLLETINRITRRALTGHPSSVTPASHIAWLQEQSRAYATMQPYMSPLSGTDNLTGETWEMRQGYRRMLKEPAISSALNAKTFAVCSLDPQVSPDDKDDPTHKKAAAWVDWSISRGAGGWPSLLFNLAYGGQIDGFGLVEKVWEVLPNSHPKYPGAWTLKAAKGKDTEFVRLRLDEFKTPVAVQVMNAAQGGVQYDPGDFLLYTYMKIFESPFGMSALRQVNRAAFLVEGAIKLRSILLENFSGPFLVGKGDDDNTRALVAEKLELARSRGWIVIPGDASLEVVNLATSAPDQFQATIEDLRKEIYLAVRGAYLQALESKTDQGNSDTHKSQTDLFEWWLAVTLSACITEQLVPDLVGPMFGDRGGRPVVTLGGIDPDSVMKELQKIGYVKDNLGCEVSKAQVLELSGVESPRDETDRLAPNPQGQPGGFGGPSPFGNTTASGGSTPHPGKVLNPQTNRWINPDNLGFADVNGEGGPPSPAATFPRFTLTGEDADEFGDYPGDIHERFGMDVKTFADRSHLVRKKITRADGVETWVWVNPDKGGGGASGAGGSLPPGHFTRGRVAEAETAVAAAVSDPTKLHAGHMAALAGHIDHLTRDRLKDLARQMEQKVGGRKAELADRIVAAVKAAREGKETPGSALAKPPAPKPDAAKPKKEPVTKPTIVPFASGVMVSLADKAANLERMYKGWSEPQAKFDITPSGGPSQAFRLSHPFAGKAIDKAADGEPNKSLPDTTRPPVQDQQTAQYLNNYSWGYDGALNEALRKTGQPPPGEFGSNEFGKPNKNGPAMFAALQKQFAAAGPLGPPPAEVTRGLKDLPDGAAKNIYDAAVKAMATGRPATMPGFVSTSTRPGTGEGFADGVTFHIRAVHGLDMRPYSHFPTEDELLLSHNSKFLVTRAEKTKDGYVIHLDQLPPKHKGKAAATLDGTAPTQPPTKMSDDMATPTRPDDDRTRPPQSAEDAALEARSWADAFNAADDDEDEDEQ